CSRIDYDGHVLVWGLTTGKPKKRIKAAKGRGVLTAQLSPDGSRLVTVEGAGYLGSEERPPELVRLIDTKSRQAWTLTEGWSWAEFSPDGKRVYLAKYPGDNAPGGLLVFDPQGKELATLVTVKGGGIYPPRVSPDGKHLAIQVGKGRINQPSAIWLYDLT